MTTKEIIAESRKRQLVFKRKYDPIRGIGSHIPRFKMKLGRYGYFHLPIAMRRLEVIKKIKKTKPVITPELFLLIMTLREDHDFEYYAYQNLYITPKEGGDPVRFLLNHPQRTILLPEIYKAINANRPIRINIVKARQWGGSTLVDAVAIWIQKQIKTGWNSCIVANVESQSKNVIAMTRGFADNYPEHRGSFTLANFENSSKNKIIKETGNVISIGSMERPENLRSGDIKIAHLTEVGLWKATVGKKPEDLIQSLRGTVPKLPWTMFVLESTAKGIGNYFHSQYLKCIAGKSDMALVFVGFQDIPMYQMKVSGSVDKFIQSWSDEEYRLWDLGATIEGINWFRFTLKDEFGDDKWRMYAEFPPTAQDAFQSTGRRYFPVQYVKGMREYNRAPDLVGDLFGKGTANPSCLEEIEFQEETNGKLSVWALPDLTINVKNRYAVSIDVGGRHEGADYSVIRVVDRYAMIYGDVPEIVAEWIGKMDYDLVAWKGAQIAKFYLKALLIPESNYFDNKGEYDEGDHIYTILDTISEWYDNLFTRTLPDRIREGIPAQWGFHTNKQTKPMILAHLLLLFRKCGYIEPSHKCLDEADSFEIKKDGRFGAVDGAHDDILIATAILMWVCMEWMEPPIEIETIKKRAESKTVTGAATF